MTNAEKFKEVFGFMPRTNYCIAPSKVCYDKKSCSECPFELWFSKEYRKCFKMREEYDDGK